MLAIDSKWHNEVTADVLTSDAAAARAAARPRPTPGRWRIVLRHAGRGDLGRRPSQDAESATRDDVEFVPGEKLSAWLRARNGQPVDKAVANDLLKRLAAFRDR